MGHNLEETARALVAPGKGILAADESDGTIKKRFDSIGIESTEDNRRAYRDMLFTTEGAAEHISGVILYDETIRQQALDGTPFPKLLEAEGVIPGIKVDKGAKDLAHAPGEKITEGLDGLRERLAEYRELGARFTKWRAVITIGDGIPERVLPLDERPCAGAVRARSAQEAGLVPIVEPEVLMDGDHSIETSVRGHLADAARGLHRAARPARPLRADAAEAEHGALGLRRVRTGPGVQEVAEQTIRCFRRHVPAAVPGIVFLSGGQTDEDATAHLNAMNAMGPHPWELSFSYGRALQAPALKAWGGRRGERRGRPGGVPAPGEDERARPVGELLGRAWRPQVTA